MNLLYRLVLIRLLTTTTIVGIFVEIGYYPGVSNIFCGYQYGMYRIDIIPKQKCYKNKVSPYPYVDAFGNINWNLTDPRIFKGNSVDRGESPWTVLIKYDGQLTLKASYCTGVLISRKWVMTAARCNFAFGQYGSNRFPRVHVFIGDSQSREKGMRLRVQLHHIWRHPKYNPFIDFDGNDIALYRLPDKIEINTYKGFNYPIMINTICLPSNHTVFNEELELTTMAGWGEIFTTKHVNKETGDKTYTTQLAQSLQTNEFIINPYIICPKNLLCIKPSVLQPFGCEGDVGAGLVQFTDNYYQTRGVLIGIYLGSYGGDKLCVADVKGAIWVPIAKHIDWIVKTIAN